jgi:flagellar M-ring protein FliF
VPTPAANAPADPAVNPTATGTAATEPVIRGQERSESRNFEMDRSVRYVVDPAPRMRRLTVGVAINDAIPVPGATTPPARRPLPAAEITRLTNLVQGAVGFSATRGDVVNIISTNFETPVNETPLPFWMQQRFLDLVKYLSVSLAIALLAFLIVRPVIRRLTHIPPPPEMTKEKLIAALAASGVNVAALMGGSSVAGGSALLTQGADGAMATMAEGGSAEAMGMGGSALRDGEIELRDGETIEELKARLKPKKKSSAISAELLDTANSYDDKVTVVRMLVSQDSRRVALVLKNLITRDIS